MTLQEFTREMVKEAQLPGVGGFTRLAVPVQRWWRSLTGARVKGLQSRLGKAKRESANLAAQGAPLHPREAAMEHESRVGQLSGLEGSLERRVRAARRAQSATRVHTGLAAGAAGGAYLLGRGGSQE